MSLKITDLQIDTKSLGGSYLLTDIAPYFEYKDGNRTDKILGYRYDIALPYLKMEKLSVKVEHLTPLIDMEKENIPISMEVDFKNLVVGSYFMKSNIYIKAQADDISIKEKQNVKA